MQSNANAEGSVTRLNGAPRGRRRKPEELAPRWGEIDPTTEDPDEIVQLFSEWQLHLGVLEGGDLRVAKKTRKRYPREYKLKALMLYRVGVVMKKGKKGSMRPEWERISQNRAAILLGIDPKQIREWEKAEDSLLESVKGSRQVARVGQPRWPEMESQLHIQFKEARKRGRSINNRWFMRQGKLLFEDLYPEQIGFDADNHVVHDCLFSGR